MADAKKVSFNQATAKSTERHNDRSMYKWGYDERSKNVHWDMYRCGSSFDAEARFYEDTFGPTLEAQNAKARAMRKYDRLMDMKTWHKKHPLKECIVQLGDVENNDTSREFAWGAAQVVGDAIKAAGGTVVSIDLHDDESTPHLHIRYAFVGENKDKNPVMDMKNVLLANGIERPDPSKPTSKTNNPAQTFLDTTRDALEDYADEVELKHGNPRVNRDRTKRAHSSVQQYKGRKRVEELQKRVAELQRQESEAIARRDAALAEIAEKRAESQRALDLRASRLSEGEEALERDKDAFKKASDKREASVKQDLGLLAAFKNEVLALLKEIRDALAEQRTLSQSRLDEIEEHVDEMEQQTSNVVVCAPDDEDEYSEDEVTLVY